MSDTGSFGYGQLDPNGSASEFNTLSFIIARQIIGILNTMKPVKVTAVHANANPDMTPTVDVQLLVSQVDGNNNVVPQGIVYGLPVFRLQAGSVAIIMDPKVNDIGMVIAADRDISKVTSTRAQAAPGSNRKFNVADSVYFGGFLNSAATSYVRFLDDGTVKIADSHGNVLQSQPSGGWNLTGGDLAVTGNITATGEITRGLGGGDAVTLGQHIHSANNVPPTPGH